MGTATLEFPAEAYQKQESNLIVIPDVNGRISAFRNCLEALGLIEPGTWTPTELATHETTRVVQAGDILGNNQGALRILDAICELRKEMQIDILCGNHEARMLAAFQETDRASPLHIDKWLRTTDGMNIFQEVFEVRDITRGEALKTLQADFLDDNGRYADLLGPESAHALIDVKNTIVTHAAPDTQWLTRYVDDGALGVNTHFRTLLFDRKNLSSIATKDGEEAAILWNNVHEPNMYSEPLMHRLRERGIEHMVHGHKELPRFASSLQPAQMMLHDIDTGIGNRLNSDFTVFYSNGNGTSHCISGQYAGVEA